MFRPFLSLPMGDSFVFRGLLTPGVELEQGRFLLQSAAAALFPLTEEKGWLRSFAAVKAPVPEGYDACILHGGEHLLLSLRPMHQRKPAVLPQKRRRSCAQLRQSGAFLPHEPSFLRRGGATAAGREVGGIGYDQIIDTGDKGARAQIGIFHAAPQRKTVLEKIFPALPGGTGAELHAVHNKTRMRPQKGQQQNSAAAAQIAAVSRCYRDKIRQRQRVGADRIAGIQKSARPQTPGTFSIIFHTAPARETSPL